MMACILVVDDNLTVLKFLETVLKSHGHVVYMEQNGKYAMDFMENNNGGSFINLVTTDREMPMMDGTEFSRQMKSNYPDIPILMIATQPSDPLVADDFLQKPFLINDVINKVNALLKK